MTVTALIAGVNKAGTTSLFVSLSEHPDVVPSAVKETRYFLPARYGRPLEPPSVWEGYFPAAADGGVRLEATPSCFYGGARVARAMCDVIAQPRVILVLREPVARALSFFTYQKVRLRFPEDLPFEQYLAAADRLHDADFDDPDNEKYMAVRGGRYADWLSAWLDVVGEDHVHVMFFEDLLADQAGQLRALAEWLHLDPGRFPHETLRSENLTTGYKNRRLQQLALAGNDRLERVLRRVPAVKRALRAAYFKLNGRPLGDELSAGMRAELEARFEEPNRRLAAQLRGIEVPLPPWLT